MIGTKDVKPEGGDSANAGQVSRISGKEFVMNIIEISHPDRGPITRVNDVKQSDEWCGLRGQRDYAFI